MTTSELLGSLDRTVSHTEWWVIRGSTLRGIDCDIVQIAVQAEGTPFPDTVTLSFFGIERRLALTPDAASDVEFVRRVEMPESEM